MTPISSRRSCPLTPQKSSREAPTRCAPSPPRRPGQLHHRRTAGLDQEYVPDVGDPVRKLGASALSTASLEAAGAPTPRGGVPLIGGDGDVMPSFGEEEPFVPRFEPLGGVVPAPVPTVSFTTPKPHDAARFAALRRRNSRGRRPGLRAQRRVPRHAASFARATRRRTPTRRRPSPRPQPHARGRRSIQPRSSSSTASPSVSRSVRSARRPPEPDAAPTMPRQATPSCQTAPSWEGIIGGRVREYPRLLRRTRSTPRFRR